MKKSIGITLAFMFLSMNSPVQSQEKVRFVLDWVIAGRHTAYYVAIDKGVLEEGGAGRDDEPRFRRRKHRQVRDGRHSPCGQSKCGSRAGGPGQGAPIKIVSIIYGKAPFMMVSKAKTGVKVPKDLEGKTIVHPPGMPTASSFPHWPASPGSTRRR